MSSRLGLGLTSAFPLLIPFRYSIQLPPIHLLRVCALNPEMAKPTSPRPGVVTAR